MKGSIKSNTNVSNLLLPKQFPIEVVLRLLVNHGLHEATVTDALLHVVFTNVQEGEKEFPLLYTDSFADPLPWSPSLGNVSEDREPLNGRRESRF